MRAGLLAAAVAAGVASGAPAAILYQETVTADGGVADLYGGSSSIGHLLGNGSTWVGVSTGTITAAAWSLDGEQQILWWEDFGDPDDDSDNDETTFFNGNEYIYSPFCEVSTGTPACGSLPPLRATLADNLLKFVVQLPPGYNNCTPTFTVAGDCAESFSLFNANWDIFVNTSGPVTFTFYDTDPSLVPEPATWALLIGGFAATGAMLRRRRTHAAA